MIRFLYIPIFLSNRSTILSLLWKSYVCGDTPLYLFASYFCCYRWKIPLHNVSILNTSPDVDSIILRFSCSSDVFKFLFLYNIIRVFLRYFYILNISCLSFTVILQFPRIYSFSISYVFYWLLFLDLYIQPFASFYSLSFLAGL